MEPPARARVACWEDPHGCPLGCRNQISDGFLYPAGTNATGADFESSGRVVHEGLDGFQIRVKGVFRFVMGMTDLKTDRLSFAADCTNVRHGHSPYHQLFLLTMLVPHCQGCRNQLGMLP
jgi:hypothetical protein